MPDAREKDTYHLLRPRLYPARLSLVIPMYNEAEVVDFLRPEIESFLSEIAGETEIVLVNDGSSDRTLEKIVDWASGDPRIKVIHLSRNFGHQLACTAGFDYSTGDAIVLMDADLQDPLPVVHEMIERYCDGYDVVYGQRERREGESAIKLFSAWAFYRIMRSMVYKRLPVDTGDFRLISRSCLEALQQMRETHRFLRGMVTWVGYPQVAVRYHRAPRAAGRSKYPWRKVLAFAWTAATSFSTLPLKFSLISGMIVGLFAVEEGVRAVLASVLGWYTVPGWTSLMVVTSVIGSALLISLGILGEYVGKIYEQSKERPLYLVSRTFNVEKVSNETAQDVISGEGNVLTR
ncbi:MAG: glycosyltransferase family 2 protein, partial [Acidobacteriaceae bacterium]|nr:glycosyltransferase family 2 protein [Acidobacteriaceae bacterium]